MSGEFQKRTGSILITGVIGFIIISFMFTGYETMRGTPTAVASIGKHEVSYREFRAEFDRQTQMYSNYMFGGTPLTSKQINEFKIKESVIQRLVGQKVLLQFADEIGIVPGPDEVKKEIKEIPVFQEQGTKTFSINRYKSILAANQLTPTDFEEEIGNKIKSDALQAIFREFPLSNRFVEEYSKFKTNILALDAVSIPKTTLERFVEVSNSAITEYLSKEENVKRAESIFLSRKADQYDQKEQVKASHILITPEKDDWNATKAKADDIYKKLTVKNFADLANKHSQDPGNTAGKAKKGGDLGWFGRGRMVKEFEGTAFSMKKGTISEPVKSEFGYHIIYVEDKKAAKEATFAEHKTEIARELIQKDSKKEVEELLASIKNQASQLMRKNDSKGLDALVKKYSLESVSESPVNPLDGLVGRINLSSDQVSQVIRNEGADNGLFYFDDVLSYIIVKSKELNKTDKAATVDTEQVKRALVLSVSRKLNEEVMKDMEKKFPVKVYSDRI